VKRINRLILKFSFVLSLCIGQLAHAQGSQELHFCLHGEPKTFDPILVDDEASENIRYLTGGVLIRVNRQTQELEPALAESWKTSRDGRSITFHLRRGIYFSDGTAFTSGDVAYTMRQLMDPRKHSATGDAFRVGDGSVTVETPSAEIATVTFPAPISGLERLFDQVAMVSATSANREKSVLGAYYVSEYKPGSYVLLRRNPNYWKHDSSGHALPYIETIRLEIQRNRDIELMRFRRGELQLINHLDAEQFDRLQKKNPEAARNAGTGLDAEQLWFNQTANSPLPAYKKSWFQSTEFRQAVSLSINRDDLVRIVYTGNATPAYGPVSPSNHFWFNASLQKPKHDPQAAIALLSRAGFRLENGTLKDRGNNKVEFTLITNSGNTPREKMATMIQQDLGEIGISVKVVTLDFPSLIERITQTFDYDACLLGFSNTDLDPNGQMTIWLSSGENHQWNPNQTIPATAWEAEIDKLMREQASARSDKVRKEKFDRVQLIIAEQQPFIYLVDKNALCAISTEVVGASPVVLNPQAFWNIDTLRLKSAIQVGTNQ